MAKKMYPDTRIPHNLYESFHALAKTTGKLTKQNEKAYYYGDVSRSVFVKEKDRLISTLKSHKKMVRNIADHEAASRLPFKRKLKLLDRN